MKNKFNPTRTRHYFFLNPYQDLAFTRCPQCNGKTKLRKYHFFIHVEPRQPLCINITCKYCESCDLIIGKQSEFEALMATCCEKNNPSIVGNKYFVIGTLDKADWDLYSKKTTYPEEALEKVFVFKNIKHFEIEPGGWRKNED